jgi:hypothetical protein
LRFLGTAHLPCLQCLGRLIIALFVTRPLQWQEKVAEIGPSAGRHRGFD